MVDCKSLLRPYLASALTIVIICLWTLLYYVSSAASGIWNKQLVDKGAVSPSVLTLLHLLVSLISDYAILRMSKEGAPQFPPQHGRHTLWDIFAYFIPVSIFVTLSKLTTYLSYQTVSIALSHTAKASEPIFNALMAALLFKEFYTRDVYLSLLPIAIGVTLASTTDFTYNHLGFFWAILSAITKVLQNIYTKKLMLTGKFTFFEIHMYCGAASLLILSPVIGFELLSGKENPFSHFPFFSLFMCSLLQYLSSIASYKVLHLVSHLTFTIVNVMKRLVIILSGMIFYGQALGIVNTCGVLLSAFGILIYNVVKDTPATDTAHSTAKPNWMVWVKQMIALYNKAWDVAKATEMSSHNSELDLESLDQPQIAVDGLGDSISYAWLQGSRDMDSGFASSNNYNSQNARYGSSTRRATLRAPVGGERDTEQGLELQAAPLAQTASPHAENRYEI